MTVHKSLLRHLLLMRSEWMEARVMDMARRNGYQQVTASMNRLFAHLGGRPVGLSELARRLGITRQAVHKVAAEAERLSLVEFVPSERDGRVKLLRFTQKGWDMSEQAARDFAEIEAELAERIGAPTLEALRAALALPWTEAEQARENPGSKNVKPG